MADTQTRSDYLKIMMGNRNEALAPYRPEQMNDLGDTSFDVASLSNDDINATLASINAPKASSNGLVSTIPSENQQSEEKRNKPWYEQIGDFFFNIGTSITEGVLNVVDSVWDFGVGVAGGLFGGGWFGAKNDFTDWAANVMTDDRWIQSATKALTFANPLEMATNIGNQNYWNDFWNFTPESVEQQYAENYEGMDLLHKGGNFIGEIIPSLVLAYFTGGASLGGQMAIQGGLGFARAYGNAASQALNEGATFQQSAGYGALSGAVESAFSAGSVAVGGMLASKGSQGFMKAASNKFGETMTARFGKEIGTAAGKALGIAFDALGEATEETVENLLDPAFKMIYDSDALYNAYGTPENASAYMAEVGKAALIAAAGSAIAGGIKEGIQIKRAGVKGYIEDYQAEIENSANFRELKKSNSKLARKYIAGQIEYQKIQQEEFAFQNKIEKLTKNAIKNGKAVLNADGTYTFTDASVKAEIDNLTNEHTRVMTPKVANWNNKYEDVMTDATKLMKGGKIPSNQQKVEAEKVAVDLSKVPTEKAYNQEGVEETLYAPVFKSAEDFKDTLISIKESTDGPVEVKLPLDGEVKIKPKELTDAEIWKISEIKPDDVKTTINGKIEYAEISEGKILVIKGGEASVVKAEPNADGTSMVYKVGDEEIPAIGVPLSPKQEVDEKYGKGSKKANVSMIVELAEGKEGSVFSYTNTKRMVGEIDRVIQDMFDDNSLPDGFREKYRTLLGREDLAKEVFTQANLSSESDVNMIRKYIENKILDSEVEINLDGKSKIYQIRNMLTSDEISSLNAKINEAFDEFIANGRTSKYSKLINEYEAKIQRLLGDIDDIRERAHLASTVAKKYNALANKLGMNGKPSQVKTILGSASAEDVAIVDFFKGVVRDTKLSRTGLTTSPIAAERLLDFASKYTKEKYGASYFWDDGIKMELDKLMSYATDYEVKVKGEIQQRHGFHPYTELGIEEQKCISNLLSAINAKLSNETYRVYQERQNRAKDGVTLYNVHKAPRHTIVGKAIDSAESFASYAANYIGKENPVYDALVTNWVNANGAKLSYQQKYTDVSNKILQEEGFKPSKGFKFLKKKVEFKGERITKGEAASIYFSALTKAGIKNGDNALTIYNPKTDSKSIVIRLNGDSDIETLKGFFTDQELRVMDRIQKEVLNGTMKNDFVSWFQKKYGFTPDVSDDYFMLNADTARARISEESGKAGAGAMLGQTWGRARGRQEYHGNYTIIDFANQFARYGNDLAHYIGYSDYNDNARVLLGTKVELSDGSKVSLNELLSQKAPNWTGQNGWERYFDYIATDSRMSDSTGGILGKIMRGGQTSVLGLNPRSMAKQWLSDFTVMGDVGIGTYLKSKARVPYNLSHYKQVRDFMINAYNLIDTNDPNFAEYEPYFAIIRERLSNKGAIKGELSSDYVGKISDITLKGMAFFDEANNVINVWAVAETLAHDYDGLKYGTQANKLQAMKYFTDLVFRTQSNNNKMYVSKLRAGFGEGGQIKKLLFGMFASDNQNKLQQVDAITREFYQARKRRGEYQKILDDINSTPEQVSAATKAIEYIDKNYSKSAWGKKASGVVAGLAMSGLGAALINETFDRILGKKDKDGNQKKLSDQWNWAEVMSKAPLEAFLNWIPYVGTIANSIENNTDMSLLPVDRLNDLKETATNLFSALQSGDSSKIGKAITAFISTYGELTGLPIGNVYKYVKGIVRNIDEATYIKTFGWMDGLKSNNISASYKTLVEKNNISGAADVLAINYSMYKTGNADRETMVEISKLSRDGYNAIARNVPDYITNEEGNKVILSDDQKAKFGSVYVRANKQVTKLIKSAKYKSMDSETKAKSIKKVYDVYYEAARYKSLGVEPDSKLGKLLAYSTDIDDSLLATLMLIQQNAALVDNKRFTKKEQAIRIVNQQPMSKKQKLLTLYIMGYGVNAENKKMLQNYLISLGFSKKQAEDFLPLSK